MGDVSSEPSMEEILSSIKRVIEESDSAPARRRAPRPIAGPGDDEILELNERVPFPAAEPLTPPAAVATPRVSERFVDHSVKAEPEPAPAAPAPASRDDSLVSADAAQASREPLAALSRMIVKPEMAGSDTLEGLVREMLRPMLRDWLDSNLPAIVETMVSREIARISGRNDG
ncbi:DUF2497 domain-containing protein [Sphingomonas sp. RS2018]